MIEAALEALTVALDPTRMLWLLLGSFVGLSIGLLPGLGGTVGMSILLPFVFGMDPFTGVALLIGMAAVVHTGDTFPSVLLGVPGSSGSQATIMDGYPLARQGQAAKALGAALSASLIGGVFGAVVLFALLSVARPLVLAMGSPQLFMLALLGLSMVGVLARGSPVAGILSGLFGLLVGTIGGAPATPEYRYTFDTLYLFDGIPIAVLALGLFALPEMLDLLAKKEAISEAERLQGSVGAGMRETFRHWKLVLRSAGMGAALGMIPGIGGAVVDWITYGIAAQTSKNNENFGKGDIRGVIAPESANNAKEGGALIPTLLFGIPGSGGTAILLGGLILLGVQPGPGMVAENLPVTLSIVWTLAIANVVGVVLCLVAARWIVKVSLLPSTMLFPFLLVIMVVASYQSSRHWGDIMAFIVIGILGWVMKQLAWPRPPMLIGFVLAIGAERYLHISMSRFGFNWLRDPTVMLIGALIIGVIVWGMVSGRKRLTNVDPSTEQERV